MSSLRIRHVMRWFFLYCNFCCMRMTQISTLVPLESWRLCVQLINLDEPYRFINAMGYGQASLWVHYLALLTVVAELACLSDVSLQNWWFRMKLAWGSQLDEVQENSLCRKKIWCHKKFWKTDYTVRKEIVGVLPGVLEVEIFSIGLLHVKRPDTNENKNSSCLHLCITCVQTDPWNLLEVLATLECRVQILGTICLINPFLRFYHWPLKKKGKEIILYNPNISDRWLGLEIRIVNI